LIFDLWSFNEENRMMKIGSSKLKGINHKSAAQKALHGLKAGRQ